MARAKRNKYRKFFESLCFEKATSRTSGSVITYLFPQSLPFKIGAIFYFLSMEKKLI
jgi:hypothetical protein